MEGGTCLRCGTPYEPDDTVCLTCGAPIGETRSNTQPVRALRSRADAAATNATLPAFEVTDSSAPLAAPTPAKPSQPARQRKQRPLWPVVLLACALVLGAFGGAAYLLRLLTAGPPVSQQTLYTDPGHRFSFQRPTLWQVSTTASGALLSDATGTSTATIAVRSATSSDTAASAADAIATPLGLSADPQQTFAGVTWERRSGQMTGQDGAVREYVVLAGIHNGQVYTIEFSSPVASYNETNTLVYEPLLNSFAFGSAG
jgi:hypothetical protein